MIANCPVCGKAFDVLWTQLWKFKRKNQFLCSYSCLREFDKGEVPIMKEKRDRKQVALKICDLIQREEDPITYLASIGYENPQQAYSDIRKMARVKLPDLFAKLPEDLKKWKAGLRRQEAPATVKIDGPIKIEATEAAKVEVVEKPVKAATALECRITGIETEIGDFQYYRRNGYLDWTPIGDNAVVSLRVEEWKNLIKLFPLVAKELGVKL